MKKSFGAVACSLLLLAACKEKAPVINLGQVITTDTTYIITNAADIPAPDVHNVLVEEYTGASCVNCPAAHEVLKELQKDHDGRINIIGLYITGPLQTKPPHDAKYDFRHAQATVISNVIYGGVNVLPLGGIDRMSVGGSIKIERGVWASNIQTRLAVLDSINLKIESSYNSTDSTASIRATIVYTKPVGYPHNLSIVVVEDSIIDVQEYPSSDPVHPGKNEFYVFTNVFRGMVTAAPVGDPVLDTITVKEAGRVLIRNYTYKTTGAYGKTNTIFNPAHCRVIAFINSTNGEQRILQSTQAKLK